MSAPLRRFDLETGAGKLVENVHPQDPFTDDIYPIEPANPLTAVQSPDKPLPPTPSMSTPDPKIKKTNALCRLIKRILPVHKIRKHKVRIAEKNARKRAAEVAHGEELMQLEDFLHQQPPPTNQKKHQFNGVSWGFDAKAGTTSRPSSGVASEHANGEGRSAPLTGSGPGPALAKSPAAFMKPVPPTPIQEHEIGSHTSVETWKDIKLSEHQPKRGQTWGLSEGGPGGYGGGKA